MCVAGAWFVPRRTPELMVKLRLPGVRRTLQHLPLHAAPLALLQGLRLTFASALTVPGLLGLMVLRVVDCCPPSQLVCLGCVMLSARSLSTRTRRPEPAKLRILDRRRSTGCLSLLHASLIPL